MRRPRSKISIKRQSYRKPTEIPSIFYAKTYQKEDGNILPGRTVFSHCRIVGAVARELMRRIRSVVRFPLFPSGSELVASFHDIGKVSPTFQKKILQNITGYSPDDYPQLRGVNPDLERQWGGHAGVTQLALKQADAARYIPEICGQHHGYTPQVSTYRANAELFGGEKWQLERENLLGALEDTFHVRQPKIDTHEEARLVAGLVSVADWIGSGELFDRPDEAWEDKVSKALDRAGFVWPRFRQGLSFQEVFGKGFKPYPVQQAFIDTVTSPGIYILEAPMGIGKTEAALYAAYRLLSRGQALGVYFALPTQLTSNRLYQRFNAFLERIVNDDAPHKKQALLLHGKAWLEATELGVEGRPGGSWFNTRKRGLLAPFAVGTLDQALMAAMNVKHGFVRAFGLAGKVVILDEIHSYDAYTGTIIDSLVKLLRKLHCTVFVLSATLTESRRSEILGTRSCTDAFPLVSAVQAGGKRIERAVASCSVREFAINILDDTSLAIEHVLERAESGQYVLWIENTVSDAQERFLDLSARAAESGISCGLLHSKFIPVHRRAIEDRWVSLFGKHGWRKRADTSTPGCILVGTQVLEQSLDIDADFMVSRFCPTDMLFQRLGRVWRHEHTPRPAGATCEVWILAPGLRDAIEHPLKAFGSTAWVYSPYILCRSLEVWQGISDVKLPNDIRRLLEDTYRQRHETGKMGQWLFELENGNRDRKGRKALKQLASLTLATGGITLPESKAQTRYSEDRTCDVLLVRKIAMCPDRRFSCFTLLDGRVIELPWDRWRLDWGQWRSISAELTNHIVSVRYSDAPEPLPLDTVRRLRLHYCFYIGSPEHDESLLRIAEVDESDCLKGYQGVKIHERLELRYGDSVGYRTVPLQG